MESIQKTPDQPEPSRKNKTPRVSVVIPCYNDARTIRDTIVSVLDQSYQEVEVIVIENGSTDDSRRVIRALARERGGSRLIIHEIERNDGTVPAWDWGFRHATGDYFAFLPAGDCYLPGKLEKQVACLEANPHIGALGTYVRQIDEHGDPSTENPVFENWVNTPVDLNDLKHWILEHRLCIATALYRKDLCVLAGPPSPGLHQLCDYEFHLRLFEWGARFAVLPEVLTCYRCQETGSHHSGKKHTALLQWVYCYSKYLVPLARRRGEFEHVRTAIYRFLYRHQPWFELFPKNQRIAILNEIFHPSDLTDFASFARRIRDVGSPGKAEDCHLSAILGLMQQNLETRCALETLAASRAATLPNESAEESQIEPSHDVHFETPAEDVPETTGEGEREMPDESGHETPGEILTAGIHDGVAEDESPLKTGAPGYMKKLHTVRANAMARLGRNASQKAGKGRDITLHS